MLTDSALCEQNRKPLAWWQFDDWVATEFVSGKSGQEFERYSRTGPYADIAVNLNDGKFVFWRGSSYLPYWETDKAKQFFKEAVDVAGSQSGSSGSFLRVIPPEKVGRFPPSPSWLKSSSRNSVKINESPKPNWKRSKPIACLFESGFLVPCEVVDNNL